MDHERTIVYMPSLDEAVERIGLPIDDPLNGQDWGLVAEGYAYVRIEFVYAEETIRVARTTYQRLLHEFTAEKFEINDATEKIRDIGAYGILDLKNGERPLTGVETELDEWVATVFAMQANEGEREWPAIPEQRTEDDGVDPITVVEPVFPDTDANTSRWMSCELHWDPVREVFVNDQADLDWEIDDSAVDDANYIVGGDDKGNIEAAIEAALDGTEWEGDSPKTLVEPDEDKSPAWGVAV
ncbi:hypothetical protein EKH57_17910 (plasmid) [Halorubrum sp. BOL3-1]|uniref:hypothetical protein n=1 Tax=Halorubrum sp. BOL3-1 TaxID=2497325 RepID=UPI001004E5EB|nr:hypothetical protein [Halorubrum sp. BOL3-1]QAU14548.1 hypothetical protein EKH57_17910 [Halorubrum sp. BOL3-1]